MAKDKNKTVYKAEAYVADVGRAYEPNYIEAEKLRLEIERLKLEKERAEADVANAVSRTNDTLSFGIGAACVIAAVCLLLGGIIGFSTGLDIGIRRSPVPRKVLVSKQFLRIMDQQNTPPKTTPREIPAWMPKKTNGIPSDYIITR